MEKKILIVEDNDVFRNYLYQVLKYDYDVTAVSTPLAALESLENHKFSLMITDLRMPGMDGRDLVIKVHKRLDANLMVIVITAFENDWPVDDAMSSHVFRYLKKGAFMPSELRQNVDKALEMRDSMVMLDTYQRSSKADNGVYWDLFEHMADAFFVCDVHLRPIVLNKGFETLTGYGLDAFKAGTLVDLIDIEYRQPAKEVFDRLIKGLSPACPEIGIRHKDGSAIKVHVWAKFVNDVSGLSHAIIGVVHDVQKIPLAGEGMAGLPGKSGRGIPAFGDDFSRIVERVDDIVLLFDNNLVCRYVNARIKTILGYAPEEIINRAVAWKDIVCPEDYHLVTGFIGSIHRKKTQDRVYHADIRVRNLKGEHLSLSCHAFIGYNSKGDLAGVDVFAEDITQRVMAEERLKEANKKILELNTRLSKDVGKRIHELRASESRYRQIVEGSGDVVFSVDKKGCLLFMNKKGRSVLGMDIADILGKPYLDFISGVHPNKAMDAAISMAVKGEEPLSFDSQVETTSGTRVFNSLLKKTGQGDEYICVSRDITKEVAKNKRLTLLANIEHYSADAIMGLDNDRNIISWNHGAAMMFGWREDEVLGKSAFIIIPDEARTEATGIMDRVKKEGFVREMETKRKTRDGEILCVSLTLTAIRNKQGNTIGFSAMIRDITSQKKMEEALVQTERLAAAGKISASIAHEINNPLYGIKSCLNHVLNTKKMEIDTGFVRLAIKESDRIADLIRNMKTFYMPTEGRVITRDMNDLVKDLVVFNRKYLEENRVKLNVIKGDNTTVECVADQIKQVFLNLFTNAVEAMPNGGRLEIETKSEGSCVKVIFRDTGIGITDDDMDHIFDMFYSKKPKVKGVGIGLSVSYGIVNRHGGNIEVKSYDGNGTTFTVVLPVKTAWGRQMSLDLR